MRLVSLLYRQGNARRRARQSWSHKRSSGKASAPETKIWIRTRAILKTKHLLRPQSRPARVRLILSLMDMKQHPSQTTQKRARRMTMKATQVRIKTGLGRRKNDLQRSRLGRYVFQLFLT